MPPLLPLVILDSNFNMKSLYCLGEIIQVRLFRPRSMPFSIFHGVPLTFCGVLTSDQSLTFQPARLSRGNRGANPPPAPATPVARRGGGPAACKAVESPVTIKHPTTPIRKKKCDRFIIGLLQLGIDLLFPVEEV
jgi:hypothetical protein